MYMEGSSISSSYKLLSAKDQQHLEELQLSSLSGHTKLRLMHVWEVVMNTLMTQLLHHLDRTSHPQTLYN